MRLMMILFSMIGTALAGSGIVLVLTLGYGTLWPIVSVAVLGAALALPVSWLIARELG
ncbi:MAG: CTP synthetase [Rhodobacter sp.]|nr:CTP synthetase [Rhodobacter sp.]